MGALAQEVIVADALTGCDTLQVNFELQNPLPSYTSIIWDFGDETTTSGTLTPSHTYTAPGVYDVVCELDGGRDVFFSSQITVGLTPSADFVYWDTSGNETDLLYFFAPAYFTGIPGIDLNYSWEFPGGATSTDSTTTFLFSEAGSYLVKMEVADENGCVDSTSKTIPISKELHVPNAFSPNGDQLNDLFVVSTTGRYIYTFRVFSRDGYQVFKSSAPQIQWNGRSTDGREVAAGMYFYTIVCDDSPVPVNLNGYLYLFR